MLPSLNQGVPRQTFSLLLLKRQCTVSNQKEKERNKTTHRTKMPGSPRQTFFCSWKGHKNQCWERCRFARFSPETGKGTKISAKRDAKWHVSPRTLEKFRLDRYRAVDRCRGVDRYSESKLGPLTAVCSSAIAVHGPITVFFGPLIGPWTAIGDGTAVGYHIYFTRMAI